MDALNKALICKHAVTDVSQEAFDQNAAAYDERFRKSDVKLEPTQSGKAGQADAGMQCGENMLRTCMDRMCVTKAGPSTFGMKRHGACWSYW
ncbi:MAG: hypothetical protein Q4E45_11720 [Eubacteriales bacterium]|nr:hypothetical protein [Eubacteriales bacterium]